MEDKTEADRLINDAAFKLEQQRKLLPQHHLEQDKQKQHQHLVQMLHQQEYQDLAKKQHQLNLKQQQQLLMRRLDQQQQQDLIKQHNQYLEVNNHCSNTDGSKRKDDYGLQGDQGTCLDAVGISSVNPHEKQFEMTSAIPRVVPE